MEPLTTSGTNLRTAFVLLLVVAVTALFLAVTWPFLQTAASRRVAGRIVSSILSLGHPAVGRSPIARRSSHFVGVACPRAWPSQRVFRNRFTTGADHDQPGYPVAESTTWARQALSMCTIGWCKGFLPWPKYMPSQEQLLQQVATAAKTAGAFLVSFASRMTATTAAFLLNLFVMLYAMFFFFRDGHKILERIFYYLPLSDEDERRMLTQFASITRATVKGTLVIGVIQGGLAGIAFWAAGIEGAALWGTIMTILSIVPGIGAAAGVGAIVIFLYVNGQYLTATLLRCGAALWSPPSIISCGQSLSAGMQKCRTFSF